MVLNGKSDGRRGIGKPRLRWMDNIETYIKALGIKTWRIETQEEKEGQTILREVKAELRGT
jgi:hypothetical protein